MKYFSDAHPRPILSVRNLSATIAVDHGIVRAINGVSFDLGQGRTLGIVGESGSGKSILCKSILNLLPATAALSADTRIFFDGLELSQSGFGGVNAVRGNRIAMIFQNPMSSLNPVMTIGKQITESLVFHLGMRKKDARNRSVELLVSVGVPKPELRIRQFSHQLSGGLCQRVAIAIALACDPELLIADEPTTALDVTVQAEILDLLARRQSERNMSMILVTHDLGVAAARAGDIIVMYAGKIVEQAPARELFSNMQMPYTRALMDSIPKLENPPHTPLVSIDGQPPDLIHLSSGCSFAPRCPRVRKHCKEAEPLLRSNSRKDHLFACWYPLGGTGS